MILSCAISTILGLKANPVPYTLDARFLPCLSLRNGKEFLQETSGSGQKRYIDFTNLKMKPDCDSYPMIVCPDGYVFLETTGPLSNEASEFLIAAAERLPVKWPTSTFHVLT